MCTQYLRHLRHVYHLIHYICTVYLRPLRHAWKLPRKYFTSKKEALECRGQLSSDSVELHEVLGYQDATSSSAYPLVLEHLPGAWVWASSASLSWGFVSSDLKLTNCIQSTRTCTLIVKSSTSSTLLSKYSTVHCIRSTCVLFNSTVNLRHLRLVYHLNYNKYLKHIQYLYRTHCLIHRLCEGV